MASLSYYLIKNRRYKLEKIQKLDDEYYKLIRKADGKIRMYTDSYIYEFEKVDNEFVENLGIFIQRKNYEDEEDKEYINSLPPEINYSGYPYIYSEEDVEMFIGDYPTNEELLKRIKKEKERLKEYMDNNK